LPVHFCNNPSSPSGPSPRSPLLLYQTGPVFSSQRGKGLPAEPVPSGDRVECQDRRRFCQAVAFQDSEASASRSLMINGSSFAPPLVKNLNCVPNVLWTARKDELPILILRFSLKNRERPWSFRSRKGKGPGRLLIFFMIPFLSSRAVEAHPPGR